MHKHKTTLSLYEKFPPSEPCSCEICSSCCVRPGWWSVEEAIQFLRYDISARMMLEISPERTFGVLSRLLSKAVKDASLYRNMPKTAVLFYKMDCVNCSEVAGSPWSAVSATILGLDWVASAMLLSRRTGTHLPDRFW